MFFCFFIILLPQFSYFIWDLPTAYLIQREKDRLAQLKDEKLGSRLEFTIELTQYKRLTFHNIRSTGIGNMILKFIFHPISLHRQCLMVNGPSGSRYIL